MTRMRWHTVACGALVLLTTLACAQNVHWAGRQWRVTDGGMAGVARGNPKNVSVDGNGFLHLSIVLREEKWTSAEVFTTERFGFGTYQWVVEGDVYAMDPSTVLGLFTYGPVHRLGVDGENEIDIEFSQWGKTCGDCNADFTVYPATGHRDKDGKSAWEDNFHVTGGNLTTARMEWTPTKINFTLMKGVQPIGTTADVIKQETYESTTVNIPQEASPVGINLWCFKKTPGQNQSVVIRSFEYASK